MVIHIERHLNRVFVQITVDSARSRNGSCISDKIAIISTTLIGEIFLKLSALCRIKIMVDGKTKITQHVDKNRNTFFCCSFQAKPTVTSQDKDLGHTSIPRHTLSKSPASSIDRHETSISLQSLLSTISASCAGSALTTRIEIGLNHNYDVDTVDANYQGQ